MTRKSPPRRKPMVAGSHDHVPKVASAASMEGMRSDHTEAAIMTPAAKPRMMALVRLGMS